MAAAAEDQLGFAPDDDAPFQPPKKPLHQSRAARITMAAPYDPASTA